MPAVISAKESKFGAQYLSSTGIAVKAWRKLPTPGEVKKVYLYIPSISRLVEVGPDYSLTVDQANEVIESEGSKFDLEMRKLFIKDFPTSSSISDNQPQRRSSKIMTTTTPPAEGKTKKQIRKELNDSIKALKSERKTLSDENIKAKETLKTLEDKAQRKELSSKVKANVARRAQLSDAIKSEIQKIKDLKVSPTV